MEISYLNFWNARFANMPRTIPNPPVKPHRNESGHQEVQDDWYYGGDLYVFPAVTKDDATAILCMSNIGHSNIFYCFAEAIDTGRKSDAKYISSDQALGEYLGKMADIDIIYDFSRYLMPYILDEGSSHALAYYQLERRHNDGTLMVLRDWRVAVSTGKDLYMEPPRSWPKAQPTKSKLLKALLLCGYREAGLDSMSVFAEPEDSELTPSESSTSLSDQDIEMSTPASSPEKPKDEVEDGNEDV
ncbi:hypothetical protein EJ08DRAFT_680970 [Tothia fuscella]|uniref:Uncharacterized protein n=1 Tax=Tothia fuscella TaxID=1048955 RepID=A0A9P4TWP2_9PEZI|nr:hypothetical protein EJ08DRAFT_680970 [Tothia fuscella]